MEKLLTHTDPVLLCNDLGMDAPLSPDVQDPIYSDGRAALSVKEAVRVATGNNFMGLICSARLLVRFPLRAFLLTWY